MCSLESSHLAEVILKSTHNKDFMNILPKSSSNHQIRNEPIAIICCLNNIIIMVNVIYNKNKKFRSLIKSKENTHKKGRR